MTTSPLEFIKNRALHFRALAVALTTYEPGSDGEYRGPPERTFVALPELDAKFVEAAEKAKFHGHEVGICSSFISYTGEPCHFIFGDLSNTAEKAPSGTLAVVSSPGRWHFYTMGSASNFVSMQAGLLLQPGIDVGWVSAGLINGFNILRLTAHNSARFPFAPHFLEPVAVE